MLKRLRVNPASRGSVVRRAAFTRKLTPLLVGAGCFHIEVLWGQRAVQDPLSMRSRPGVSGAT